MQLAQSPNAGSSAERSDFRRRYLQDLLAPPLHFIEQQSASTLQDSPLGAHMPPPMVGQSMAQLVEFSEPAHTKSPQQEPVGGTGVSVQLKPPVVQLAAEQPLGG